MHKFDVLDIDRSLYLVVQAEHLLELNTIIVVPIRPANLFPALRRLTVDIDIQGVTWRVLSHMPLTLDARMVRNRLPVHRLSPDEGHKVMEGLNAVLWGL
jgi:CcdB protein